MLTIAVRVFIGALLIAANAACSAATTYDPYSEFSLTNNPNGVWSYGYGIPGAGTFTLSEFQFDYSGPGYHWTGWNLDNHEPSIYVGHGSHTDVNVPNDVVGMHPGNADDLAAIVMFTAQISGSYTISGSFEKIDTSVGFGTGVELYICKNLTDCSLYSNYLPPTTTYLQQVSFSFLTNLAAGDTIEFEVARHNGVFINDSTGLKASLTTDATATPEPSSLMLLGTGIGTLSVLGRRRLHRA